MTMTLEQANEAAKGMTFEKVWLYFQESKEEAQKQYEETQRQIRELSKIVENQSKNINGINDTIGKFSEAMFLPEIHERFKKFGYNFRSDSVIPNRTFVNDNDQKIAEADIYLANETTAMIVEVKAKISQNDIDEHITRINNIRNDFNNRNDRRKIIGTIASPIIDPSLITYAHNLGLFVLVQSGESVKIADMPENFKPKTW